MGTMGRMPFPLSVADVWRMFEWADGRRAKDKEAACEWLDSVYTDLEDNIERGRRHVLRSFRCTAARVACKRHGGAGGNLSLMPANNS
jgi:hypothetical protein